jgi:hypothetical protein
MRKVAVEKTAATPSKTCGKPSDADGCLENCYRTGGIVMLKVPVRSLIGLILICTAAHPARAGGQIAQPDQPIAGQSQLFWAQAWWQWLLGIPTSVNPNLDTTGSNASVNNNGPVFFLAGNFGGSSTRTVTVPYGKPVFFPVFNEFFAAINAHGGFDPKPCAPLTISCAVAQASGPVSKASNMSVTIDNITLTNADVGTFRQTSTSFFTVALPQDNVLGVTPIASYNGCWTYPGFVER